MDWVTLAVTGFKVGAALFGGSQAKKAGRREGALLRQQAGARRGEGHYAAEEERRQARYIGSRAQAVSAASGAGGTGVVNLLADLDAEGEYRALTRRYSADTEALDLDARAQMAEKGGSAGQSAGYLSAATTLFTEGSEIWDKYKTSKQGTGA